MLDNGKETTTTYETSLILKNSHENLVEKNIAKSIFDIEKFLCDIYSVTISDENYTIYEAEITEDNLFVAQKSIPNNDGNDGLSKEFYELLLGRYKRCFINSLN